ncbi:hypothetical protein FPV67DRAFT_275124 [Lyophyllum atratum]|nr:hypothetical protein FPV67DRAFT_275124 [Lyophyllum atratum]
MTRNVVSALVAFTSFRSKVTSRRISHCTNQGRFTCPKVKRNAATWGSVASMTIPFAACLNHNKDRPVMATSIARRESVFFGHSVLRLQMIHALHAACNLAPSSLTYAVDLFRYKVIRISAPYFPMLCVRNHRDSNTTRTSLTPQISKEHSRQ